MTDIKIENLNAAYDKIICERSIALEIANHFAFEVPNAKYITATRFGWDGKTKLFNIKNHLLPSGLRNELIQYCNENDISLEHDNFSNNDILTIEQVLNWSETLNLPKNIIPHNYQLQAVIKAHKNKKNLFLSATNSGKTLIAYLLYRWFDKKTLIITNRAPLVNQFKSDWISYNCDPSIFEDKVTCSTWQGLINRPKEWFEQFDLIIGDECHNFQAKSLSQIMNSCINAYHRFGLTGSIQDAKVHEMILKGHFGDIIRLVTNQEMIDNKRSSEITINIIILKYSKEDRKFMNKRENKNYPTEIEFLETNSKRNNFIINMIEQQKQNTFIIFKHINHGNELYNKLKERNNKTNIFYASGSGDNMITADEAEILRKQIDSCEESATFASISYFSEGIDIKNLNDIILSIPVKSKIKILQSLGRGFRISDKKKSFIVWDIGDDLIHSGRINYSMKHLYQRIEYYVSEGFKPNIYEFNL